jgi:hypothetical protein
MKTQKVIMAVVMLFAVLTLAACVANPVEQLEQEAAEQIAEQIIEQAGGVEDVQIEVDGDSVSYSVDDGEGGEISVDSSSGEDIDAITGMGFNIPLPSGIKNGTLQRVDDNGVETMINAQFELDRVTFVKFVEELHETLTAQGFTYVDLSGTGATEPDPATLPIITYTIESDGVQFSIMGDDEAVLLGLTKGQ